MSDLNYITILNIPIRDLTDPKYQPMIKAYAGERAAPCVAEGLMALLRRVSGQTIH